MPSPRTVKQTAHLFAGKPTTERKPTRAGWTSRASCWVEKPTQMRSRPVVSFIQHPQRTEQQRCRTGPLEPWGKARFCASVVTVTQICTWDNISQCPSHTHTHRDRHAEHRHIQTHTDTRHTDSQAYRHTHTHTNACWSGGNRTRSTARVAAPTWAPGLLLSGATPPGACVLCRAHCTAFAISATSCESIINSP